MPQERWHFFREGRSFPPGSITAGSSDTGGIMAISKGLQAHILRVKAFGTNSQWLK
jgi:hypothetical protein